MGQPLLQRVRPLRFVLQHHFSEQAKRRRAVAQHFIVEFLQGEAGPFLLSIMQPPPPIVHGAYGAFGLLALALDVISFVF